MTVTIAVQMVAQPPVQECVPAVKPLAMLPIAITLAIIHVRLHVKETVIHHVREAVTPAADKTIRSCPPLFLHPLGGK